jgi:hypothetical protein
VDAALHALIGQACPVAADQLDLQVVQRVDASLIAAREATIEFPVELNKISYFFE